MSSSKSDTDQQTVKRFWQSLGLALAIVLAATPIIVMLVVLVRYSVNTPWWDQFSFVDLMTKLHNGTLTLGDLWAQHNEHRILVPQAWELAVGSVSDWNFRVPVLMNLMFDIGTYVLMVLMLLKTLNRKLAVILAVIFSWLLFSPIQSVNWIWGFQLAFHMDVFFTVLGIWLLTRKDLLKSNWVFPAALVVAALTTYCNGNGLLIWPIGLGLLAWQRAGRQKLLTWSLFGLAICGTYLYHFHRSPGSPPLSEVIKEPVAVLKYLLIYLGRTLSTDPNASKFTGIGLLVVLTLALVAVYKKKKLGNIAAWLAIVTYVVLTALLAAVSRLNFGVNHSFMAISYTTMSVTFVLAVLAITFYALQIYYKDSLKHKWTYGLVAVAAGLLCIAPIRAYSNNYRYGLNQIRGLSLNLKKVQTCIYTATSPKDDCLMLAFPDKNVAWKEVESLRSYGWGDFKK